MSDLDNSEKSNPFLEENEFSSFENSPVIGSVPAVVVQQIPESPVPDICPAYTDIYTYNGGNGLSGTGVTNIDDGVPGSPLISGSKRDLTKNGARPFVPPTKRRFRDRFPLLFRCFIVGLLICLLSGIPTFILPHFTNNAKHFDKHFLFELQLLSTLIFWTALAHYFIVVVLLSFPAVIGGLEYILNRQILQPESRTVLRHLIVIKHYWASFFSTLTLWLTVEYDSKILKQEHAYTILGRILGSKFFLETTNLIFIFAVLMLFEKFIVQRVAINTHQSFYAERMEKMVFTCEAISQIINGLGGLDENQNLDDSASDIGFFGLKSNKKNKLSPKVMFYKTPILPNEIRPVPESTPQEIAEYIMNRLAENPERPRLYLESFQYLLSPSDCKRLFMLIINEINTGQKKGQNGERTKEEEENNGTREILSASIQELTDLISQVQLERDNLAEAIVGQTDQIAHLNKILLTVVFIIMMPLSFAIYGISTVYAITFITSYLLYFKFMLEGVIETTIQSIIFIFAAHPFDIGDIIVIGNKDMGMVKSLGWSHSSFYGPGSRIVYMSNMDIVGKPIMNFRRSGPMSHQVKLSLSTNTTDEQFAQFENQMREFVNRQFRHFEAGVELALREILYDGAMDVDFKVTHRSNFQKLKERDDRIIMVYEQTRNLLTALKIELAVRDF